jgi:ankyrin repeat domain-containing protein 50
MARIKRAPRANPTRLQLAVRENDLEQVRLLIQQHKEAVQTATTATSPGALPSPSPSLANMVDFQGRTILQEALIQDNPAMARLILDEVAEEDAVRLISHTDERDRTALHEVVLCNNGGDLSAVIECAKRMLQMGDVAAVFSSRFRTPLHEACYEGNLELVRLFLEFASCDSNNLDFSAILERRDRSGYTALFLATMQGHFDVVKLMIEYGANWYAPENYGRTPLSAAISYRQLDILNFLLDLALHQQNAETKFDEMLSNLMGEACRAGYEEGTMALLKRGASTKAKDTNGRLPLHWACETGCLDLVKILVERSEMDATDLCLSDNNGILLSGLHFRILT